MTDLRHSAAAPPLSLLDELGIEPGVICADVGVGVGALTIPLARRLQGSGSVFAVELGGATDLALRLATEGLIGWVVPIAGEGGKVPLPNASVDAALCADAVHRVEDFATLAVEIFRVLRPQGRFVVADWSLAAEPSLAPGGAPPADQRAGVETVTAALAAAGFEEVSALPSVEGRYVVGSRKPALLGSEVKARKQAREKARKGG